MGRPGLNLLRIEEELSAVHLRLAQVSIENLPYQELIPRFDRPHTFFYLDPPYYGIEDYYGKGIFHRSDYSRLSSLLSDLAGKFIMSINDTPEIRAIFSQFSIIEVPILYQQRGSQPRKRATELLIRNYK